MLGFEPAIRASRCGLGWLSRRSRRLSAVTQPELLLRRPTVAVGLLHCARDGFCSALADALQPPPASPRSTTSASATGGVESVPKRRFSTSTTAPSLRIAALERVLELANVARHEWATSAARRGDSAPPETRSRRGTRPPAAGCRRGGGTAAASIGNTDSRTVLAKLARFDAGRGWSATTRTSQSASGARRRPRTASAPAAGSSTGAPAHVADLVQEERPRWPSPPCRSSVRARR